MSFDELFQEDRPDKMLQLTPEKHLIAPNTIDWTTENTENVLIDFKGVLQLVGCVGLPVTSVYSVVPFCLKGTNDD